MSECSTDWDCKCQDSSNNTYLCVRTVSNPGNTIFCIFEDQENFENFSKGLPVTWKLSTLQHFADYTSLLTFLLLLVILGSYFKKRKTA